ncbi:MAG: hypothetical protein ACRD2Y_07180, partial [Terriglobales bacterium]
RLKSGALSFTFMVSPPHGMPEPRQSLYRKPVRAVICGAVMAALILAASAQTPRQKRKAPTLRALGVLELNTDSKSPGRGRLVPIFVLDDGKYFDAGLYRVRPWPMAVEPGTIYEAERSGEPAGLFTVEHAADRARAWFAVGAWVPREFEAAKPVTVKTGDDEDAPPVLRKPKAGGEGGASSPPKPAKDATGAPGHPAGRDGATQAAPEEPDPDRPVLRRGKPKTVEKDPEAALEEFSKSVKTSGLEPERLVAISDAGIPERRPFAFPWQRDEEEQLKSEVLAMAQAELAKSLPQPAPKRAATQGGAVRAAGTPKPALPALEDVRIRAFDLNYDNNPEIVLMARHTVPATATAPARAYYVTVVAAVAIGGELRRLLAAVTDDQRLDSVPRMELIDAVDAEGNGDGELLFRRVGRTRESYELFRVGMDKLWTLFEGAASPL